MYRKRKDIRKRRHLGAFAFVPSDFWGRVSNSLILNDIGRHFLLGSRKKLDKCLMRTFTCRSLPSSMLLLYCISLGYALAARVGELLSSARLENQQDPSVYTRNNNPFIKGQSHESNNCLKVNKTNKHLVGV
jgi:hypothetical protein